LVSGTSALAGQAKRLVKVIVGYGSTGGQRAGGKIVEFYR